MGRKSKATLIDEKTKILGVKFKCGACEKIVTAKVNEWDFSSGSGMCDICGSHGHISVTLTCPKCKYTHHYVELSSW